MTVLGVAIAVCVLGALAALRGSKRPSDALQTLPSQERFSWRELTVRVLIAGISVAVMWLVHFSLLRLADPTRYVDRDVSPEAGWEAIEVCILGVNLGVLLGQAAGPPLRGVRRCALVGISAGLLATALQLMGILVAGLAAPYWFSTFIHQEIVFPAVALSSSCS